MGVNNKYTVEERKISAIIRDLKTQLYATIKRIREIEAAIIEAEKDLNNKMLLRRARIFPKKQKDLYSLYYY